MFKFLKLKLRHGTTPSSGCACLVLVLAVNLLFGGLATQYVFEFWVSYIKGAPVNLPFWPCALAGLFVGEFTVPIALVTWVLSPIL